MKTKAMMLSASLLLGAFAASCSLEQDSPLGTDGPLNAEGKGKMTLKLSSDVSFQAATRAVNEASYQVFDNYNVQILDQKGNKKFEGTYETLLGRLPLELDLGSYTILASFGEERPASRDDFHVSGENTFSIEAGKTISTSVNCTPTCGKISAEFDAEMSTYYDEYYLRFTGTAALTGTNVTWGKEDTAPYYVALDAAGETVTYTIHLNAKEDYATKLADGTKSTEAEVTGSFQLQRNKAYKLRVKPNYTPSTEGGLSIIIVIDESTNDKPINIEVPVTWI